MGIHNLLWVLVITMMFLTDDVLIKFGLPLSTLANHSVALIINVLQEAGVVASDMRRKMWHSISTSYLIILQQMAGYYIYG